MSALYQWLSHSVFGAVPAGGDTYSHKVLARRLVKRGDGAVEEKVPLVISFQLGLLHATWLGQQLARTSLLRWYLRWTSVNLGIKYDSPDSREFIPRFIQEYGVDISEIEGSLNDYRSLNEFFARRLRPEARPIHSPGDARRAVQPADARLHVFESAREATRIWIKGEGFTVGKLVGPTLAKRLDLEGCSLVISRLAPQDYHRFHSPVNGTLRSFEGAGSELYSVKPVAVRSSIDVFGENKRLVVEIDSPDFGIVAYVIIAAVQVGSITMTTKEGQTVSKGQELGYFSYGGSTVITVFQRGAIEYDVDLRAHSRAATEVLVQMGESLGVAAHA
ncbi:phosphatidylserine decarboxylase proenzyme 2 [Coccomyxa sp. Obi]|nr:phosphatidylserine decarboxylase proenzyme 2 [Coccomyxa sp. Obi]